MKVFAVIGLHHSGKTTACEQIMSHLKNRGHSVSSIKDIHQENFSLDRPGSNSNRHLKVNKESVFARSLNETCLIWDRQLSLNDMLDHLHTDWVCVEGMKESPLPKVLCANNLEELEKMMDDTVFAISGPVTDTMDSYKDIPVINARNNPEKLTNLIIEKVFDVLPFNKNGFCGHCGLNCFELTAEILRGKRQRSDCAVKTMKEMEVLFNGEPVLMNAFVSNMFNDVLNALCKNLKGYQKGSEITIHYKEKI